mgnify:CR=1 FL=1
MEKQQGTMEKMEMINSFVDSSFWKNKRVFVTGHTGFKGGWLCIWLYKLGANIKGYSLEPNTTPSLFDEAKIDQIVNSEINDIRDFDKLEKSLIDFDPQIIFHLAAQPLVRDSYDDPISTYSTNVMGTLNILEAARKLNSLKSFIIITTDKCYENDNRVEGYVETDPMGGYDPYSSSKGCCELLVNSFRRSFYSDEECSIRVATVRAGNVIGGGDWSKDRLIPDVINSILYEKPLFVRNPHAVRPWQHVLEPISGYLILAQNLYFSEKGEFDSSWNFGPNYSDCKSVKSVIERILFLWNKKLNWEFDSKNNPHEANFLKLNCNKAKNYLGWVPIWNLDKSIEMTVQWSIKRSKNVNSLTNCLNQIQDYIDN